MSSWYDGQRPLTLAVLAMGGEGGGVLADWIVEVAEKAGYWAQSTSVPGVAQRTGATVYYVELFPPTPSSGAARAVPVLSVFPTPGEVDVVVASELMEAGRAVQRGFSTPDRTTLITSTHRVFAIDERMAPGDGRANSAALLETARRGAKRLIAADFMAVAEQARSVISASLFGALAGCGVLPFGREQFEQPIRDFGKGVEQSLAAFAAGYEAARSAAPAGSTTAAGSGAARASEPVPLTLVPRPLSAEEKKEREDRRRNEIAATDPGALVGPKLRTLAAEVADLPAAARSMILHGLVRTAVYQNKTYARRYLERVARFAAVDPDAEGAARLTVEAARHLALWMCYQDTIQVALQKTRRHRMDRIRAEARAEPDQLIQVREYLHPQSDEITDTLPERLGATLRRSTVFGRVVRKLTHRGMIVNTSSIPGYTALSVMARVRPLRPRSLRFAREQAAIEEWLAIALSAASIDADLAREIVECQRVLKGYGATWEHGWESFTRLMAAAQELAGTPDAAERLARLRDAALADEDGAALAAELAESAAASAN
ncbi:indolepyruvate oxidoreductase subunit beta family protein [Nocardia farcinica]|uniref:indolepyruvate oxidoreductase subunit beta family protein n=1 Tax=Nocardia farcinica TaxID=37329 RepID=UPI00189634F3|nr:indolepyruvate oxidoreductase subunit beta family protein [Nocardia farcinica]MBF6372533.1 indolepyruvate oxidoreductase subunit beta family protein [Nocardia farcinica]